MKVVYGQNIIDVAIQEYGKAEAIFELAQANGLSLSEIMDVGQSLGIDANNIQDLEIVQFFKERNFIVVTGNETEATVTGDFGLEFNEDFGSEFN
jgi:hypothetical protein